eukprot:g16789.t1
MLGVPAEGLARLRGNIWCVKTAAGCYHRVRLTLNGVAVTSGRIITRPEASQLLRRLRGAAQSAEPDGPEAVLRALDAVGCHAASEDGLGLSYQVVLDARSSVGKRLHSPSCSVEEVIALRRQVSDLEHRHCKGRRWRWSKEKAESIFSEMKHSSKAQHAGRMAKSLELKAQRAEKAMQEVARVSDAVSTAKRRWLPLGEAPGLLEAVEPCMRQLARVEPSTHGPHEIMTVTWMFSCPLLSNVVRRISIEAPVQPPAAPATSGGAGFPFAFWRFGSSERRKQERDSLRSRSKEGRPGSRKHRRYTHSVDLVNSLRRVMDLPSDVDAVEEERPQARPSAFYRLLESEGPNALEVWAAAEARGRSPRPRERRSKDAAWLAEEQARQARRQSKSMWLLKEGHIPSQGTSKDEAATGVSHISDAADEVRRTFRENWQYLSQSQSSQELIAKLEELTHVAFGGPKQPED